MERTDPYDLRVIYSIFHNLEGVRPVDLLHCPQTATHVIPSKGAFGDSRENGNEIGLSLPGSFYGCYGTF